jgi:hypothetical protein
MSHRRGAAPRPSSCLCCCPPAAAAAAVGPIGARTRRRLQAARVHRARRPSASFAQQCAASQHAGQRSLRTSTLDTEKKWLRAYFDEAYLWREVPSVDPRGRPTAAPTSMRPWTPTSRP